jgi:hypothetical protein
MFHDTSQSTCARLLDQLVNPEEASNCSTRVEEGTPGRKRLLDRLKSCQAMAFPSVHDRAHGGKEVSSPVGAKPVRHFSKDCAHADGLFAGVIGGGNGGIF